MQILVLSVAALVPLVITPGLLFHFDITPKIAILLFGVILMLQFGKRNVNNFCGLVSASPGKWFAILLAVEWTSAAMSTALSTNRAISLNGGIWRQWGLLSETALLLFLVLAAGWLARDRPRIRALMWVLAVAGTIASLYGIGQYFGRDPLLPSKSYEIGEGVFAIVRPPGTLGHADYFGSWLLVAVFQHRSGRVGGTRMAKGGGWRRFVPRRDSDRFERHTLGDAWTRDRRTRIPFLAAAAKTDGRGRSRPAICRSGNRVLLFSGRNEVESALTLGAGRPARRSAV